MSSFIATLYLLFVSKVEGFIADERGDLITQNIVIMIIAVVIGAALLLLMQTFLPTIWARITDAIGNMFP